LSEPTAPALDAVVHTWEVDGGVFVRPGRYDHLVSRHPTGATMSAAARDDSRDRVDDVLDRQLAGLRPEADRLRAALLRGESPESLGLVEDGLATVLEERDIR
jgi:hypothetical protein